MNDKTTTDIESRARAFAIRAHGDQKYGSGPDAPPYVVHLDAVRGVLRDFDVVGTDHVMPVAAYLHDVLEDTAVTWDDVCAEFGERVADLVNDVTGRGPSRKARVADAYAKIINGDRASAVLKLADRIANVEASAPGSRHLALYRDEQAGFEAMLAKVDLHDNPDRLMLERLRRALGLLPCGCPPERAVKAWIGTPPPGWRPGDPAPHVCPRSARHKLFGEEQPGRLPVEDCDGTVKHIPPGTPVRGDR